MKKSEMYDKIHKILWMNRLNKDYEVTAKKILKIVELYMKPKAYRYEDGDLGSCFKEGWESED